MSIERKERVLRELESGCSEWILTPSMDLDSTKIPGSATMKSKLLVRHSSGFVC